jgi:hypothetical protein
MNKIVEKNGKFMRVEMTLEEKETEYQKALQECYTKREAEYPKVADYLDAQAKGDIEAMDAWNTEQLAVKSKYPKPSRASYELD